MQKIKIKFLAIIGMIVVMTGCKLPEIKTLEFRMGFNCIELSRGNSSAKYAFSVNEGIVIETSSLNQNGKEIPMTPKGSQVEFTVDLPVENVVLQAKFKSGYQATMLFDPQKAQFLEQKK
jgi:hypothetical protein